MKPLLLLTVLLLSGGLPAQEPQPVAEAPDAVTPASDKEETGALTDLLPGRVEPLTLPDADANSAIPEKHSGLFPDDLPQDTALEMVPPADDGSALTQPPPPAGPLPPEVAASCFGPSPPPPLHDPQHLLPATTSASLLALLRDSLNARGTFMTSIVVLGPEQQIPVTLNPTDLLQKWYGSGKCLLVLYFLGRPDRTQAFFSPAARKQYRTEDLRQLIDFGVREAERMDTPVTQLQRFCYKTAVRLDRLHRLGTVTPTDEPAPLATAAVPAASLWWAFAIGVQAAGLACAAVWWWRRRRAAAAGRDGDAIHLPEQDLVCRLGASYSGGSGAVIQFGSAARVP